MKKLTPGCVAAHLAHRIETLKRLDRRDERLIKALLDPLRPHLRLLFDFDPNILYTLLESGCWVGRYKEPMGEFERVYPSISVLRSRLRTLRKEWAGLIKISIRQTDATHTRVRFTVIEAPKTEGE